VFVCIPPGKAVPEMTYTVLGRTLNPTHSLTFCLQPSANMLPLGVVIRGVQKAKISVSFSVFQ